MGDLTAHLCALLKADVARKLQGLLEAGRCQGYNKASGGTAGVVIS